MSYAYRENRELTELFYGENKNKNTKVKFER